MSKTVAKLNVVFEGDTARLDRAADRAERRVRKSAKTMGHDMKRGGDFTGTATKSLAAIASLEIGFKGVSGAIKAMEGDWISASKTFTNLPIVGGVVGGAADLFHAIDDVFSDNSVLDQQRRQLKLKKELLEINRAILREEKAIKQIATLERAANIESIRDPLQRRRAVAGLQRDDVINNLPGSDRDAKIKAAATKLFDERIKTIDMEVRKAAQERLSALTHTVRVAELEAAGDIEAAQIEGVKFRIGQRIEAAKASGSKAEVSQLQRLQQLKINTIRERFKPAQVSTRVARPQEPQRIRFGEEFDAARSAITAVGGDAFRRQLGMGAGQKNNIMNERQGDKLVALLMKIATNTANATRAVTS